MTRPLDQSRTAVEVAHGLVDELARDRLPGVSEHCHAFTLHSGPVLVTARRIAPDDPWRFSAFVRLWGPSVGDPETRE